MEGAIAACRQPGDVLEGNVKVLLAGLLTRHGRVDEATVVLRELADAPGGTEDWVADLLCTHYTDLGRPEDGLAFLDAPPG